MMLSFKSFEMKRTRIDTTLAPCSNNVRPVQSFPNSCAMSLVSILMKA